MQETQLGDHLIVLEDTLSCIDRTWPAKTIQQHNISRTRICFSLPEDSGIWMNAKCLFDRTQFSHQVAIAHCHDPGILRLTPGTERGALLQHTGIALLYSVMLQVISGWEHWEPAIEANCGSVVYWDDGGSWRT